VSTTADAKAKRDDGGSAGGERAASAEKNLGDVMDGVVAVASMADGLRSC
jgi:hypothetical protein